MFALSFIAVSYTFELENYDLEKMIDNSTFLSYMKTAACVYLQ